MLRLLLRISSELRGQAAQGPVSAAVGESAGVPLDDDGFCTSLRLRAYCVMVRPRPTPYIADVAFQR